MSLKRLLGRVIRKLIREDVPYSSYQNISKTARISDNVKIYNLNNLILEDNTNIDSGAVIMNPNAKFIMKRNSGAAIQLLVLDGNHMSIPGHWFKDITDEVKRQIDHKHEYNKDVIVEEDVWIGSRVTLLSGVRIGRGSSVGSGAVVRDIIPPYSIVIGNPAKVVGFKFTPEEIIEHEKVLYSEEERLSLSELQYNYEKYFLKRIKEIKDYTKI